MMNGQWIGKFTGQVDGDIVVNVDDRGSYYQGVAYLNSRDQMVPSFAALFRTRDKGASFDFRTDAIHPIDLDTGVPNLWEKVRPHYSAGTVVAMYAEVRGTVDRDTLTLSWVTDFGGSGTGSATRSKGDEPSDLVPLVKDWDTYKRYITGLVGKQHVFRGQEKPWRLRTSFHRAGRFDLMRFINEDINTLHRHLCARTKHVFNLDIPKENGAFLNLVQHHGYPTPLLDWTYSPYVAAYFAYRKISHRMAACAKPDDKVRIFVFDQQRWREGVKQLVMLATSRLHLSNGEFLAIDNERMIPQQAVSTVTNAHDIEGYVRSMESEGRTYLWAVDLPVGERDKVIEDLRIMGITAGSLFPGLDGACEALRDRNFGI